MSKNLILQIKGKDTIIKCIKPDNTSTYVDGIDKGFNYLNVSQKTIAVNNLCNKEFILPAQILFTQSDSYGSTFQASIADTLIPAQASVNVPVYYTGIYNGVILDPEYAFMLNGVPIIYKLNVNLGDTLGTITDMTFNLGNRISKTFTPADFVNHYADPNGDTIVSVFLFGNVSTITYNNNPYTANMEVSMIDVQAGRLKHQAPDTNSASSVNPSYKIKDSLGNIIT